MNVAGIIAEYNPFHNGHLFHLQTAREQCDADYVVCVMSGHFLQRGEPAIFDKWSRAAMAVAAGADLVFELPFAYACRSAGVFARGGVELLASTGIVSHLCFGSEAGSLDQLNQVAALLKDEQPLFKEMLRAKLQNGLSYPTARHLTLQQYNQATAPSNLSFDADLLAKPNNTLAIEYLIALTRLGNPLVPVTVKRHCADYHDLSINGPITSATAIRRQLETGGFAESVRTALPPSTAKIMQNCLDRGYGPVFFANFERSLLSLLRRATVQQLSLVLDINEGLENKLKEAANTAASLESLLKAVKSKRYTRTRLQRILTYCLLNFSKQSAHMLDQSGPQYLRLLAFSFRGRQLLKIMRKNASLPVIHKPAAYVSDTPSASPALKNMLRFDILATDLYVLGCPQPRRGGLDYLTGAVMLSETDNKK